VTNREPDAAKARNSLITIRKGLGLRHPRLAERLGDDLRALWGITPLDTPEEIQRKAIAHLELAISQRLPEHTARIARDYFNVSDDAALWALNFEDRLKAIHTKYGPGHAPREIRRRADLDFLPVLLANLDELAATGSVGAAAPVRAGLHELGRDLHDGDRLRDRVANEFLRAVLYVPHCSVAGFRVAQIPDFGDWLPVFLSPVDHAEYGLSARVPPPWLARRITGAALLLELRARAMLVGVVIDPEPRVVETLHHTIAFPAPAVELMISRL
jgi:hypothetical protein